jgi:hypothetical protein
MGARSPPQVRALLSDAERRQLAALCGRCLYHSLTNVLVGHDLGYWVFVATGELEKHSPCYICTSYSTLSLNLVPWCAPSTSHPTARPAPPAGDIPDMWIRDSSVQLAIYLPRAPRRPALRRLIEGALRTQAFLITQDPYANAYASAWRPHSGLGKFERLLGRGGWVATRNYELVGARLGQRPRPRRAAGHHAHLPS